MNFGISFASNKVKTPVTKENKAPVKFEGTQEAPKSEKLAGPSADMLVKTDKTK